MSKEKEKIIKSANVQYGSICFLVPVIKRTNSLDPAQSQDLQLLLRTFLKEELFMVFKPFKNLEIPCMKCIC